MSTELLPCFCQEYQELYKTKKHHETCPAYYRNVVAADKKKPLETMRSEIEGLRLLGENPYGPLWGVGWEHCRQEVLKRLAAAMRRIAMGRRGEKRDE